MPPFNIMDRLPNNTPIHLTHPLTLSFTTLALVQDTNIILPSLGPSSYSHSPHTSARTQLHHSAGYHWQHNSIFLTTRTQLH
ncbi:hypothetical protein DFJ58DRAFT_720990 [Suillus subalutaceus]|nr:uncharacterized protein DFJ58DRAFT_734577 [Suillus subalutaceus]XP_041250843.1 uncharacterized protein DFJ58DRAFT_720990 [Suillus subalutaceus]KAG1837033.1 hypothetical protein DFJ58DRAFT_734577 [Suillus subalutaceus]KAG1876522.1 hypothetical protein DFJ58DRAFT_720990 [Suillus subalutaceus]